VVPGVIKLLKLSEALRLQGPESSAPALQVPPEVLARIEHRIDHIAELTFAEVDEDNGGSISHQEFSGWVQSWVASHRARGFQLSIHSLAEMLTELKIHPSELACAGPPGVNIMDTGGGGGGGETSRESARESARGDRRYSSMHCIIDHSSL
jgi:hypothetical protein